MLNWKYCLLIVRIRYGDTPEVRTAYLYRRTIVILVLLVSELIILRSAEVWNVPQNGSLFVLRRKGWDALSVQLDGLFVLYR